MTGISYTLSGERAIGLKFERFPTQITAAMERRMKPLVSKLEERVRASAPLRTGALQASIQSFVDVTPKGVTGRVKALAHGNKQVAIKAIALEYGAHGSFKVQAHRSGKSAMLARLLRPSSDIVKAYQRTANITATNFMRGPLEAMQGEIISELQAGLADAVAAS